MKKIYLVFNSRGTLKNQGNKKNENLYFSLDINSIYLLNEYDILHLSSLNVCEHVPWHSLFQ